MEEPAMETEYHHTQIGTVTGGGLLFAVILCAGVLLAGFNWITLGVLILMAVLLPLFASLTVTVTAVELRFRLGIGPLGRRIPLADIESCEPVRNRWWYGWGIRFTPHGWLYNVSGLDAVELHLRNGKRLRIGTDEQGALCDAIRAAAGRDEK